ncbi:MAG: glycosyl hydrolase family 18 protein [Flavobacteriaceae bacterium]|jgi:chitinase
MKNFNSKGFCLIFIILLPGVFIDCSNFSNKNFIEKQHEIELIAYYAGDTKSIDEYDLSGVTQLIYSFLHLKGNELSIDNKSDSLTLIHLSALKNNYPKLKVLVSLGGWGGCKSCSSVFSSEKGRKEFAKSTARIIEQYNADGIDLDWEYPVVPGPPGHPYSSQDKDNFTALIKELKAVMHPDDILSFAAGGFPSYLEKSIDWNAVMPLVDHVNIMSYDLYGGYSKFTGHHTPLYSNADQQSLSADQAVKYLIDIGIPANKIVIGAAFYGRIWKKVPDLNNGLYQPGVFYKSLGYNNWDQLDSGYEFYRDQVAKAPYAYNKEKSYFFTFDDSISVIHKTKYAKENGLKGIMFWQLMNDKAQNGLLSHMVRAAKPE